MRDLREAEPWEGRQKERVKHKDAGSAQASLCLTIRGFPLPD